MSLARTSRTSRLVRTPRLSAASTAPLRALIRHNTTDASNRTISRNAPLTGSVIPAVDQSEIPIDHGTSAYSPVQSFPQPRGPDDPVAAAVISGAPQDLQARTVRIFKPTKPATQSGNWNGRQWRMDWDVLGKGHRWENLLMGWQSSGDYMQGTHMFFKTKEDAINFADKQGYDWFVQEPNKRDFRPKSYAANFVHSPKKLKMIRTK